MSRWSQSSGSLAARHGAPSTPGVAARWRRGAGIFNRLSLVAGALCAAVGCSSEVVEDIPPPVGSSLITVSAVAMDAAPAPSASSAPSSSSAVAAPDDEAIRSTFFAYRKAISDKKGDVAASLVTESTIAYYEKSRVAALSMKAAELKKQPLMDRLIVLAIRHRLADKELAKLDGRGLFAAAVDAGMVMDAGAIEPDAIERDGAKAQLGLRVGTTITPPKSGFAMRREAGGWRIDVLSVAAAAGAALEGSLKQLDPDPDKALLALLELSSGTKPSEAVWQPLDARPADARPAETPPAAPAPSTKK